MSSILLTWGISSQETPDSVTVVEEVEIMYQDGNKGGCKKIHPNGCHSGGPGAISCGIDDSYHACIGRMGGNCTVSCQKGYYSCCGVDCKCLPEKPEQK